MHITFTRMHARIQGSDTLSTHDKLCSRAVMAMDLLKRQVARGEVVKDNLLEEYVLCKDDEYEAQGEAQLVPGHDVLWPG